jgi:uncharacterized membrane protein YkvA (DUF1232 family)
MTNPTTNAAAAKPKVNDPSVLIEIWRSLQLVGRLMLDSRVPFLPKLIVPLVLLYILSPIDLVPDFFIALGLLDDIALLFFGTKFFIQLCPPDVVLEHRRKIGGSEAAAAKTDYVDGTYRFVDED